jgi:hypothetical protein
MDGQRRSAEMSQRPEPRRDLSRTVGTALGNAVGVVVFLILAYTILEGVAV